MTVASPGKSKQDDKAIFENDMLLCSILDSLENIFKVESCEVVKMDDPLRDTAIPVTASLWILCCSWGSSRAMLLQARVLLSSVRSSKDSSPRETGESAVEAL